MWTFLFCKRRGKNFLCLVKKNKHIALESKPVTKNTEYDGVVQANATSKRE